MLILRRCVLKRKIIRSNFFPYQSLLCVLNDNSPAQLPSNMISNTRDGDVVTSILAIENVSVDYNGTGCFCSPSFGIRSIVGVISVVGETVYIDIFMYMYFCYQVCTDSTRQK